MLTTMWSSSELTIKTKKGVLISCIFWLLYAAETWTIKAADSRKLLEFETKCYWRMGMLAIAVRITFDRWRHMFEAEVVMEATVDMVIL